MGVSLPLSGWSRLLGMTKRTLLRRLRSGWSVRKTLSTPPEGEREAIAAHSRTPHRFAGLYSLKGRTRTVREWAAALGVSEGTVRTAIRDGRTVRGGRFAQRKGFTHNGLTLDAERWAKKLGISPQAFRRRIGDGLPEDEVYLSKKAMRRHRRRKDPRVAGVNAPEDADGGSREFAAGVAEGMWIVTDAVSRMVGGGGLPEDEA